MNQTTSREDGNSSDKLSFFLSFFLLSAAYLSESEGEDPADSQVTLPQRVPGRGNIKAGQSAIRLTEVNYSIYQYPYSVRLFVHVKSIMIT